MKRWVINKVGDDELFLIKNILYVKKSIGNDLELTVNATTYVVNYKNYGSVVNHFCFFDPKLATIFYIFKRSSYKAPFSYNTGSLNIYQVMIHHSCYKELIEWLKPKIELDIIL